MTNPANEALKPGVPGSLLLLHGFILIIMKSAFRNQNFILFYLINYQLKVFVTK